MSRESANVSLFNLNSQCPYFCSGFGLVIKLPFGVPSLSLTPVAHPSPSLVMP